MTQSTTTVDLTTTLGRLLLPNPILVASGTFGYAREMENVIDVSRLGGVLPKTITAEPRVGNAPWRTVETSAGLLNAIGLDNDGIDAFLEHHLPYLRTIGAPIVVSVAGRTEDEFVGLAARVAEHGADAVELNLSCPNVSGGIDFGINAESCRKVVAAARKACSAPILAKLTPNVTKIAEVAKGAADGGADAVCLINTVLAMAIDWRRQKPVLGNGMGGLSGPAIKPIALRCVHQVRSSVDVPIIGIGGISNIDDVMQFLVAGASAVQIGTANYYDPTVSTRLIDELPVALSELNATSVKEVVGSLTI
ncbi:dihydroorotate dehydrogenase [Roseiconus lacunae]|uniref:Dihydroorotate dehydrogenase n=1 Tax=Roseiconus lacunae TaxID=2605694 RepID=A0ABT7PDI0_9BACT|nr:dihydroorotate dehydrogenase [Roseiconus lacunae]MDM4014393.1 dihydroorotate dehydrogenase [Roseiconus lacunae]